MVGTRDHKVTVACEHEEVVAVGSVFTGSGDLLLENRQRGLNRNES
jgi:hypothetical protein